MYLGGAISKEKYQAEKWQHQVDKAGLHSAALDAIMDAGRTLEGFAERWAAAQTPLEKNELLRLGTRRSSDQGTLAYRTRGEIGVLSTDATLAERGRRVMRSLGKYPVAPRRQDSKRTVGQTASHSKQVGEFGDHFDRNRTALREPLRSVGIKCGGDIVLRQCWVALVLRQRDCCVAVMSGCAEVLRSWFMPSHLAIWPQKREYVKKA